MVVDSPMGGKMNRFEPGKSGNAAGRPPKLLTHVLNDLKAQGYEKVCKAQIAEAYELLFNLPLSEVSRIASKGIFVKEIIDGKEENVFLATEKDYPAFVRIVARAMLSNNKGFEMIEKMQDRVYGQAKQQIEMKNDEETGVFKVAGQEIKF